MATYKLSDNVIARVAQILQEGILLGVDIVDLLRQVEVTPGADNCLELTAEYRQFITDTHKKLIDETAEHQAARQGSKVIFTSLYVTWRIYCCSFCYGNALVYFRSLQERKMNNDRLLEMWEQQHAFMKLLQEKRGFPQFPVDMTTKEGQKFLKGITHDCMGELFEANQELKNSKGHRATEVTELDRDAYLEELVDSLHFFFEIAIASGISVAELYEAYMKKGHINTKRIQNGY